MMVSNYCRVVLVAASVCATALSVRPLHDERRLWSRASEPAPSLKIDDAELTSKWADGSNKTQIVQLRISNTDDKNYVTGKHKLSVSVESESLTTVVEGHVKRLAPGQSQIVQVGVENKGGISAGKACDATVVAKYSDSQAASLPISGICGIPEYEASTSSLQHHGTPDWFDKAKYGIFIHWGIYAAPAYGNVGSNEAYAEWYWNAMHDPNSASGTYQYHKETYGEDFNYDQFIDNFTVSEFDPKQWVDLFSDAGAQYFVPTTKHHDGFAIFDFPESISKRSSVHYGPKKDIIGELFAAAKEHQPHLRRGTYFSMPEWYNPLYAKYHDGSFPGGPPTNPYSGEAISYTGFVDAGDFVEDIQLPQMRELAYEYGIEMMWCDIGGANNATIFASEWLNWARDQGRQVTFNNRCGIEGDFDTPEYATNNETVVKKWEASRGMDPHSYGYNYQTPDDKYMTGEDIVTTLVDIVSKNGNFLLDIGPDHNGAIKQIMQDNLRDAGQWIHAHGESIFSTRYWNTTAGEDPFRYTTTDDAFYIHYIGTPPSTVSIPDPVPYLAGDKVTVVGGGENGSEVPVKFDGIGTLKLEISDEIIKADQYVWTFKIAYED